MSEASAQAWEPGAYLKFADLRLRPALDLLAQVPLESAARITDLGCGAGGVTRFLRHRWPEAEITALDSSPEMLARAKAEHGELNVAWRQADVRTWAASEPQDLVYSNAVLHWLDNHETLLPRLMGELSPGGVLGGGDAQPVCTTLSRADASSGAQRPVVGCPDAVAARRPGD